MTKEDYDKYEKAYNRRTLFTATRASRWWTASEDQQMMEVWCAASTTVEIRIRTARLMGRTYLACLRRHGDLHRKRGDGGDCRALSRIR